jgi:hypothetical protein
MPVHQSIDVAVPLETAYNQWTQFEQWPQFMRGVTRVIQEDDATVWFETKLWGRRRPFTAVIDTQRPDERIRWRVTEGITHTGVVSFHELAPRLTRIELLLDIEPSGMLEKAARGLRQVKRAAGSDLDRFKALVELLERETGAWRGVIEAGEVVERHDPAYDEQRDYGDLDDLASDAPPRPAPRGERSGTGGARRGGQGAERSRGRPAATRSRGQGSARREARGTRTRSPSRSRSRRSNDH